MAHAPFADRFLTPRCKDRAGVEPTRASAEPIRSGPEVRRAPGVVSGPWRSNSPKHTGADWSSEKNIYKLNIGGKGVQKNLSKSAWSCSRTGVSLRAKGVAVIHRVTRAGTMASEASLRIPWRTEKAGFSTKVKKNRITKKYLDRKNHKQKKRKNKEHMFFFVGVGSASCFFLLYLFVFSF